MSYDTKFNGEVTVEPPPNEHEISYLRQFNKSYHIRRIRGPYVIDFEDPYGLNHNSDVLGGDLPPSGQPGPWCQWVPTDDGEAIKWDGEEKFYDSFEWMVYLVDTFLRPGATVQGERVAPKPGRVYPKEFEHFTFDHFVNGVIDAQGEDMYDSWRLVVENNNVRREDR